MKQLIGTITGTDSKSDCVVGSRAVSILLPHWRAAPRSDSPEVFRVDRMLRGASSGRGRSVWASG